MHLNQWFNIFQPLNNTVLPLNVFQFALKCLKGVAEQELQIGVYPWV